MPSTARQLRQPPTIEAIGRVPYFADVIKLIILYKLAILLASLSSSFRLVVFNKTLVTLLSSY